MRICFARSSHRASCKSVPRRSLQVSRLVCIFVLRVWNSFHCPRGVHSHLVRKEMFIGFRGLAKPYSPGICSTLPDSVTNLSTRGHGYMKQCCLRELHHFSLVRLPEAIFERCFLVAFHVIRARPRRSMTLSIRK